MAIFVRHYVIKQQELITELKLWPTPEENEQRQAWNNTAQATVQSYPRREMVKCLAQGHTGYYWFTVPEFSFSF